MAPIFVCLVLDSLEGRSLAGRRWRLEDCQLESATMNKTHLLIDANSSRVGLKRGQERHAALGVNVARDCGDKSLSIAVAAEVRVRADSAHFREAGRSQSLASHCSEAAIDANP